MPEPVPGGGLAPVGRGRVPSAALATTLRSQVAAVMRVLDSADRDAKLQGSSAFSRLHEKYRAYLEETMKALAETLAGFLEDAAEPVDLEALRVNFLEPILSVSRALPAFHLTEEWAQGNATSVDLQRLTLERRLAGFDFQTLLLVDFYHNTAAPRSFRARAEALANSLHAEAAYRRHQGSKPVNILVLGANSVLNLRSPFQHGESRHHVSMLIVDGDTQALRRARQLAAENLQIRPATYRATPVSYVKNAPGPSRHFDIAYTLMLYDTFSTEAAVDFTRHLSRLLRLGGTLLTGCYLPSLSRQDRALATALTGLTWCLWDEAMWWQLLSELPFDAETSEFSVVAPHTLTVSARRG